MNNHTKQGWGTRLIDRVNIVILFLFAMITVLPFLHIVASSVSSEQAYLRSTFMLFPTDLSLSAYHYIFSTNTFVKSILVTIFITVIGTMINMVMTSLMAYPLSRKDLWGRKQIMLMIVFTMLFSGGMIPTYLLLKSLGFINTYWSLMVPGAIGPFLLIIMRNFFMELPDSLEESAKIDGCNDLQILVRIVLPLSKPVLATLTLFYAVGNWNTFMSAVLYINDASKYPIQVLLRSIVLLADGLTGADMESNELVPTQTVKMAVIAVATIPILCVYPFLQKHFTKGVLLGSVKG